MDGGCNVLLFDPEYYETGSGSVEEDLEYLSTRDTNTESRRKESLVVKSHRKKTTVTYKIHCCGSGQSAADTCRCHNLECAVWVWPAEGSHGKERQRQVTKARDEQITCLSGSGYR